MFFGMKDDLPFSKSKYAEKANRIEKSKQNYFNDILQENELQRIERENEIKSSFDSGINNASYKNRRERRNLYNEEVNLKNSTMRKTLVTYLTEMVINGLVLDDYFIDANRNSIFKETYNIINNAFENNDISEDNFSNSIIMQEAIDDIQNVVSDKFKNNELLSEDIIYEILEEATKAKNTSDEIAKAVKEKVTETIGNEKKIADKKEKEKAEEDDKTEDTKDSTSDDETNADSNDNVEEDDNDDDTSDDDIDNDSEDDDISDDNVEDSDGEEESDDDTEDSDGEESDDDMDDDSSVGDSGELKITIKTNGTSVKVSANKSESMEFINLFGSSRYNERNSKSLFRNMFENKIREEASIMSESVNSSKGLNMDLILGESICEYTLLETLMTSKLINLNENQINSINKSINFNRN